MTFCDQLLQPRAGAENRPAAGPRPTPTVMPSALVARPTGVSAGAANAAQKPRSWCLVGRVSARPPGAGSSDDDVCPLEHGLRRAELVVHQRVLVIRRDVDVGKAVAVHVADGRPADVRRYVRELLRGVAPVPGALGVGDEDEDAVAVVARQEDVGLAPVVLAGLEGQGVAGRGGALLRRGGAEAGRDDVLRDARGADVLAVEGVDQDGAVLVHVVRGQQLQPAVAVEVLPGAGEAGPGLVVDHAALELAVLHVVVDDALPQVLRRS
mmetsp:Transcript_10532/g.32779  ORF Transcript_10532/g.32779 Transcript_10532/m.32779 type:complete len:267 (-) Transcript_10532:754-1554(-)